jgi:hypothetical protein
MEEQPRQTTAVGAPGLITPNPANAMRNQINECHSFRAAALIYRSVEFYSLFLLVFGRA